MLEIQEKENGKREKADLLEKKKVADVEAPKKATRPSTTEMAKPPASTVKECRKEANFFERGGKWRNKWADLALKGMVGIDSCVQPQVDTCRRSWKPSPIFMTTTPETKRTGKLHP